eukprot:TRINITY_DN3223_c1_g1_i10.p1 TRINITY_DN3223_c1_g1~~TRINITY_DN3223_c1_g1_i10.p1  ORF type:complete len:104 (-),score=21.46 TRINITY_DN3223_c1_g1_i10:338-649(-)
MKILEISRFTRRKRLRVLIWMDEVATEYALGQSIGRVQIDGQEDERRTSLEEMKQEIKHEIKLLRECRSAETIVKLLQLYIDDVSSICCICMRIKLCNLRNSL